MANRNKSYDEVIAKKFENLEYAQGYLLNIVESEGLAIDKALREVIKAMGLQNFSKNQDFLFKQYLILSPKDKNGVQISL